jgi:hypothetical protein
VWRLLRWFVLHTNGAMTEHPCLVAVQFHGLRRQCVGTVLGLGGGGDKSYAQVSLVECHTPF